MWTVLSRKKVKFEFLWTDVILGFNSLWPNDHLTNPAMPKTHIPYCPILMQKCAQTCMSAKNGALWAMGLVHCGIGEIGHWPLISDCYFPWNICQTLVWIISDTDWRTRGHPSRWIPTRGISPDESGVPGCCAGGCFTLCQVQGWPPSNSGGWACRVGFRAHSLLLILHTHLSILDIAKGPVVRQHLWAESKRDQPVSTKICDI